MTIRRPWLLASILIAVFVGISCIGATALIARYAWKHTLTHEGDKDLVVDWLKKNLNDPTDMEIVEWAPRRYYVDAKKGDQKYGVSIYYVKVRAKNAFGAKILNVIKFDIKDGKVVDASTNEPWPTN